eukprot:11264821-Ditylum_brightwellii.AAC.1
MSNKMMDWWFLKGGKQGMRLCYGGNYLQLTTELWGPVMEEMQAMTHMVDEDGWEDDGEILKA